MKVTTAPDHAPWLWTLAFGYHEDRTPTHGLNLLSVSVLFVSERGAPMSAVAFRARSDTT